jgi:hypothetical protein
MACTCKDYLYGYSYIVKYIFHIQMYTSHKVRYSSGTHLITRHALPRWPCNSTGGQRTDFRTTHHGALFTDANTFIGTPQLLWAHTLDLRPIFCGHKFVHVLVMHAFMRGSIHVVSQQAGRLLDTGFSTCLQNCTSIRRACCARPSTERRHREWHVVWTRFSCHVPENTTKEHGLGTYWA